MPTEPVLSEKELTQRVHRRIDDGRLPVMLPSLISAGYGTGARLCVVCDLPISSDKVMYEIDDPCDLDGSFAFHFGCYVVWQRECAQLLKGDELSKLQNEYGKDSERR